VLFADLRQFTSLSERLRPEEVVEILNAYFDRMTRLIAERGGRIDKFIGDAIMADWGALDEAEEAETEAVRAALAMVSALATFNEERGLSERPLAMGIGIHASDVVAGSIGSTQKLEFTVIGDTVNVASRLEGLTKRYGAAIVASREVVAAVGEACVSRRLDRAIVAGREDATELCEILSVDDPRAARIGEWERAIDLYFARRFEDAASAFEEAARDLVDPAAQVQLERCRELARNPPAEGWTGTARLTK
jgi:adenylate cyclase